MHRALPILVALAQLGSSAGCSEQPTAHPTGADANVLDGGVGDASDPLDGYPAEQVDAATSPDVEPPPEPDAAPQPDATTPPCGQGSKPTINDTVWPTPTKKTLCQGFGNKISYQTCGFHTGIDVCTAKGDPILSIAAGKVVHVGPMWYDAPGKGRGPHAVIIEHSPGFYSTYGHNDQALVAEGDCVAAGDKIATIGSLGYSSGPHLHFEMLDDATFTGDWAKPFTDACSHYVDPMDYLEP